MKSGVWRKKKPSAATARKVSNRPNARPPKPAARPRKSATARTRKPSARPNSKPRSSRRPYRGRPPPPCRSSAAGARARRRRRRQRRGRRSAPDPPRPRRSCPPRNTAEDHRQAGSAEAARPPDPGHRAERRRRPRTFDRLVPPPHPAPEGPCVERAEGKADPRSRSSRKPSTSRNSPTAWRSARST